LNCESCKATLVESKNKKKYRAVNEHNRSPLKFRLNFVVFPFYIPCTPSPTPASYINLSNKIIILILKYHLELQKHLFTFIFNHLVQKMVKTAHRNGHIETVKFTVQNPNMLTSLWCELWKAANTHIWYLLLCNYTYLACFICLLSKVTIFCRSLVI